MSSQAVAQADMLLIMAGLALVTIIPAGRLPTYVPGEVPSDQPPRSTERSKG